MNLSILDKPIAALKRALPTFSLGELEMLKEAEENGKTRAGAIEAIEAAIADTDPPEPVPDPRLVRNHRPGTTVHLGDGRKLAYGEAAEVEEWLADLLRERGQAE
jgi:hypothetical protein